MPAALCTLHACKQQSAAARPGAQEAGPLLSDSRAALAAARHVAAAARGHPRRCRSHPPRAAGASPRPLAQLGAFSCDLRPPYSGFWHPGPPPTPASFARSLKALPRAPRRRMDHDEPAVPNFQDIFSLRRPRDAKAGISSGLKSFGKGIVGGAVGLFAAPVVGATQDGLSGFAKGVATGAARRGRTAATQRPRHTGARCAALRRSVGRQAQPATSPAASYIVACARARCRWLGPRARRRAGAQSCALARACRRRPHICAQQQPAASSHAQTCSCRPLFHPQAWLARSSCLSRGCRSAWCRSAAASSTSPRRLLQRTRASYGTR